MSARAVAVALLCSGSVAACGDSGTKPTPQPPATRAVPPPVLHGGIGLADCRDWNRGPEASRRATLLELRSFFGGEVSTGNTGGPRATGPVLDQHQAYELLGRSCTPPYARGFKLYKLYGRAAGFAGSAP